MVEVRIVDHSTKSLIDRRSFQHTPTAGDDIRLSNRRFTVKKVTTLHEQKSVALGTARLFKVKEAHVVQTSGPK